ncbi:MAG TPA: hypothetical protein VJI15_02865 [Candidatus Nanoarchaeia archaeon]|nr:hypothetical protein [Candidatus Nanoarchaeia archaeon]
MMIKKILLFGLFVLSVLFVVSCLPQEVADAEGSDEAALKGQAVASCIDRDGGKNYGVKGTTKDSTGTKTDICESASTTRLIEYYCYNNRKAAAGYNCATEGKICKDGACVAPAPVCGDGIANTGEDCANCAADIACPVGQVCAVPAPGETGPARCQLLPVCGDGVVNGAEVCDDGNTQQITNSGGTLTDTCSSDCKPTCIDDETVRYGISRYEYDFTISQPVYGIDSNGETYLHRDVCSSDHLRVKEWYCGSEGVADFIWHDCNCNPQGFCETPPVPVCGNGVLDSGEVCDDGNTNPINLDAGPADQCSADCFEKISKCDYLCQRQLRTDGICSTSYVPNTAGIVSTCESGETCRCPLPSCTQDSDCQQGLSGNKLECKDTGICGYISCDQACREVYGYSEGACSDSGVGYNVGRSFCQPPKSCYCN